MVRPAGRAVRIDEIRLRTRQGPLAPGSSDQDHVFRVYGQVVACFRLGEPRELHDRTASRIDNDPFDVLDVAVDAVPVSGHHDYLRRGGRGLRLTLARAHQLDRRVKSGCALGTVGRARSGAYGQNRSRRLSSRACGRQTALLRRSRCYGG